MRDFPRLTKRSTCLARSARRWRPSRHYRRGGGLAPPLPLFKFAGAAEEVRDARNQVWSEKSQRLRVIRPVLSRAEALRSARERRRLAPDWCWRALQAPTR